MGSLWDTGNFSLKLTAFTADADTVFLIIQVQIRINFITKIIKISPEISVILSIFGCQYLTQPSSVSSLASKVVKILILTNTYNITKFCSDFNRNFFIINILRDVRSKNLLLLVTTPSKKVSNSFLHSSIRHIKIFQKL